MRLRQLANNFHVMESNTKDIYFSYETPIAFRLQGLGLIVCKNIWSSTTGKHLNMIEPNHNKRIDYEKFQELFYREIMF